MIHVYIWMALIPECVSGLMCGSSTNTQAPSEEVLTSVSLCHVIRLDQT